MIETTSYPSTTTSTVSGLQNIAMGGKFSHGFVSTFITSTIGSPKNYISGEKPGIKLGRTLLAAVTGGTVSSATGGKFANGAITSFFSHLLNAEASERAVASSASEGESPNDEWDDTLKSLRADSRIGELFERADSEGWVFNQCSPCDIPGKDATGSYANRSTKMIYIDLEQAKNGTYRTENGSRVFGLARLIVHELVHAVGTFESGAIKIDFFDDIYINYSEAAAMSDTYKGKGSFANYFQSFGHTLGSTGPNFVPSYNQMMTVHYTNLLMEQYNGEPYRVAFR